MVTTFPTTRGTTIGLGSKTFFAATILVTLGSFAKEAASALLDTPPTVSKAAPSLAAAPAPSPARIPAPTHAVRPKPLAALFTGMASWYGSVLHDHRTASGRRFNMFELTAAHRSLPFGSKVRVTDLRNRKSVVVTITDRGVLNANRVIDLSYGAAQQLDMIKSGVDPVRLDVLTKNQALLAEAEIPPQP